MTNSQKDNQATSEKPKVQTVKQILHELRGKPLVIKSSQERRLEKERKEQELLHTATELKRGLIDGFKEVSKDNQGDWESNCCCADIDIVGKQKYGICKQCYTRIGYHKASEWRKYRRIYTQEDLDIALQSQKDRLKGKVEGLTRVETGGIIGVELSGWNKALQEVLKLLKNY